MKQNLKELKKEAHLVDDGFKISLIVKGFDGLLETVGGLILAFVPTGVLNSFLIGLTRKEILEDPKDLVANYLINLFGHLSVSVLHFTVFFLLIHGLTKLFLVAMLLAKKLWAYPTAMVVFSLFGIYQIYQYSYNHSLGLLLLTVLDLIVIILTWLEFRNLKRKLI